MENWTVEEASNIFDQQLHFVCKIGEIDQPDEGDVLKRIEILNKIESLVRSENIFSENEEITDILPEHLKYLNLPYLIGMLKLRVVVNRLDAIKSMQELMQAYIHLLSSYQVCPEFIIEEATKFKKGKGSYDMGRDEKIRMDREKKVAEEEAKYATTQFARGEINEHAFHSKMFKLYSYNALRELSFVDREIQILEFRKKLEEDQEVKEQYEREISKPLGKPKAWRIPAPGQPAQEISLCENHRNDIMDISAQSNLNSLSNKTDILNKVFQPDHAQPRMTLEEHGDLEYRLMMEKHERTLESERLKDEYMARLTKDEIEEIERLKASEWDNYKDETEKGAGNKGYNT